MNLERTVKWIDKTGIYMATQTGEISSARPYSTPAGSSNIDSRCRAIKRPPKNFSPSSVCSF